MVGLKYANLRPLEMFYISRKWAYKCSIPPMCIGFSAFCGQKTSRGNAKNLRVCENFAPPRLNFPWVCVNKVSVCENSALDISILLF